MRKYILDANVIFSALISGKQIFIQLFEFNKFYSPDFMLVEIEKYKSIILEKSNLTIEDLQIFIKNLFQHLTVIPSLFIKENNKKKAEELCRDIDPKDTVYIALAIEMNIPLVTRDISLYNGLKKKGFNNVILLDELIQISLNK